MVSLSEESLGVEFCEERGENVGNDDDYDDDFVSDSEGSSISSSQDKDLSSSVNSEQSFKVRGEEFVASTPADTNTGSPQDIMRKEAVKTSITDEFCSFRGQEISHSNGNQCIDQLRRGVSFALQVEVLSPRSSYSIQRKEITNSTLHQKEDLLSDTVPEKDHSSCHPRGDLVISEAASPQRHSRNLSEAYSVVQSPQAQQYDRKVAPLMASSSQRLAWTQLNNDNTDLSSDNMVNKSIDSAATTPRTANRPGIEFYIDNEIDTVTEVEGLNINNISLLDEDHENAIVKASLRNNFILPANEIGTTNPNVLDPIPSSTLLQAMKLDYSIMLSHMQSILRLPTVEKETPTIKTRPELVNLSDDYLFDPAESSAAAACSLANEFDEFVRQMEAALELEPVSKMNSEEEGKEDLDEFEEEDAGYLGEYNEVEELRRLAAENTDFDITGEIISGPAESEEINRPVATVEAAVHATQKLLRSVDTVENADLQDFRLFDDPFNDTTFHLPRPNIIAERSLAFGSLSALNPSRDQREASGFALPVSNNEFKIFS